MDIDREVAEKVFGWKKTEIPKHWICDSKEAYETHQGYKLCVNCQGIPNFSSDISEAFNVIEHMRTLGYICDLHHFARNKDGSYMWECIFDTEGPSMYDHHGTNNNPSMAVCIAALKSVGGWTTIGG